MDDSSDANSSDVGRALGQVGSIGKRLAAEQVGRRAAIVGRQLSDTSAQILEAGEDLRKRESVAWLGDLFDYAAAYCDRAGSYLQTSEGDRLAADFESFGRSQPALLATLALGSGFALARVLRVTATSDAAAAGSSSR